MIDSSIAFCSNPKKQSIPTYEIWLEKAREDEDELRIELYEAMIREAQ